MTHPTPSPSPNDQILTYQSEVFAAGLHSARPPFTFHALDWEQHAHAVLPASSWAYLQGNCSTGETYTKNRAAFTRYSIVPRRLVPSRRDDDGKERYPDTTARVLGQTIPFPIALAPIGVQTIFHPDGEMASARAAARLGIPYILSTAASASIEDVAAASGDNGPRWFQLYWPPRTHDDVTASLLRRARAAGYTALFVTLDTYVLGWRPGDLDNGYNPFLRPDTIGVEIGFTDPVFRRKFQEAHGVDVYGRKAEDEEGEEGKDGEGQTATSAQKHDLGPAAREWAHLVFPGHAHSWDDLAFLRTHWDGPIVLKGIQSVADARRAAATPGITGIVVSNHGGRQTDGGAGSLSVLPRIVDAVGDRLEVLFDSGVRGGADALKALALGAKCVLLGRPYAYGLAMGGEEGVRHVLRATCGDLVMNMHLAGLRGLDEVDRDVLVREDEL